MKDKILNFIFLVFAGFMVSVIFSWVPLLAHTVVASVITSVPDINWYQATFFTWIGATFFFVVTD